MEFVFKFKKSCSCQHQDTVKVVKENNDYKLYVNNFLLYRNKKDILDFLNKNKAYIPEEDYRKVLEVLS
ncbi:MAG: hypothetical protein QXX30_00190 [Candidatus Aenigmatarchaeota archaeon]